jgi:hypothetical protein
MFPKVRYQKFNLCYLEKFLVSLIQKKYLTLRRRKLYLKMTIRHMWKNYFNQFYLELRPSFGDIGR